MNHPAFHMRHAWLIIAHNEFEVLQRLVSALDSPICDLYIHYDKKVQKLPNLHVEKGQLFILPERVDVRWGTVSQIKTELLLLETAIKRGPYAHYHILSGTHLPLKSIDDLTQFYEAHSNEEIMRFWPEDAGDADFKLRRYHFPTRDFKSPILLRRFLCQKTWTAVLKIQKIFGIRHLKGDTFRKTDQWLSLTEAASTYLVLYKTSILRKYKWAFCPDEYFVASELMANKEFKFYDCPQLLLVEFERESPKSIPLARLEELKNTDYLWARKFSASI